MYGVPPPGAVHLDASASVLAARQPREVVFYRDGVEFYRFTTSGPPLDVVFGGPAMAVVLESEAVHRIRLATPPVVVSHAAQAGTEFRSLSLSAPGPGGARRIAVGARSPLPQGWRGRVEIVGSDDDFPELMRIALERASRRVVLKWPRRAEPPQGIRPCSHQILGKSTRYDVYMTG